MEGEGKEPNHTTAKKIVLSSINHSIFSGRREPSWAGLCDIVRFEE
jgi:hypothetical protein